MTELSELSAHLASLDDMKVIERFFDEIMTPAEKKALALRWELMKLLKEGVSQRRIAAELGISLCKITRGSRELRKRSSVARELLDRRAAATVVRPEPGRRWRPPR